MAMTARLVLNYKGIPYKTEWIEYPDLKPTFSKFGIPAHTSGPYEYTSPTIRLPSGEYVMESRVIADKLEQLHPSPSLHLDSPYLARMEQLLPKIQNAVRPIFMPRVPKTFLNPVSRDYFVATREKAIGMSLDEYASKNTEQAWEDVRPLVKELAGVYAENPQGPFLMGNDVSYADFMVVGFLRMFDRLGAVDQLFAMDGGEKLKEVYGACAKWLERDTY
ncbi:uncharacterized protein Z520_07278 [Fonsecaea multimorphosa CBS 102226]|uniref:GST N-terminal domain-containing protein n=1 Tax=Fonsecaea multimorphosa CBS 102226 TaxID=1442371 RepID=A0A0D2K285_9EURO|nr:uncharacterized protein Z520_07278 [Fonsecaea multimorphosa CBS 102226]KIX97164.1 hypothetical protein Z520_07278 [Fonsecaea multimorphosa CBS 102226]OAL22939.1 hypothetical protein AYO22_06847 [Fonsecaea multimorphosa]